MPTTIGLEGMVYVQVERSTGKDFWYSNRVGEVFACRSLDSTHWVVVDPRRPGNHTFLIDRGNGSVLPHAHVVARPGWDRELSIEYWKEVAGVVPGVPVSCARRETAELADRVTMIEKEIRPDVSSPRGLPGSVVNRVTSLEADLCAHSIAARKADDDLAARIERLEHAHKGTVPVDKTLAELFEQVISLEPADEHDVERLRGLRERHDNRLREVSGRVIADNHARDQLLMDYINDWCRQLYDQVAGIERARIAEHLRAKALEWDNEPGYSAQARFGAKLALEIVAKDIASTASVNRS